jgi:hypothetical protein
MTLYQHRNVAADTIVAIVVNWCTNTGCFMRISTILEFVPDFKLLLSYNLKFVIK